MPVHPFTSLTEFEIDLLDGCDSQLCIMTGYVYLAGQFK